MELPKQAAEKDLRIAMVEKLILATLADRNAGLEKSIAQWRGVGRAQPLGHGSDGGASAPSGQASE